MAAVSLELDTPVAVTFAANTVRQVICPRGTKRLLFDTGEDVVIHDGNNGSDGATKTGTSLLTYPAGTWQDAFGAMSETQGLLETLTLSFYIVAGGSANICAKSSA